MKKIKNQKDISMASPNEVKTQTGYTIGGVSPVGHLNKIEIYIFLSLAFLIIFFGIYPDLLLNTIDVSTTNLIEKYKINLSFYLSESK